MTRRRTQCPTCCAAPAAIAAARNAASTTGFVMAIARNATSNIAGRGNQIRSTTRLRGDDSGKRSWQRIRCAVCVNTMVVSLSLRLSTTAFRSSMEAHRSIGKTCNLSVRRVIRGSRSGKGLDGLGVGRGKSLQINSLDRRPGTVCIAAKYPQGVKELQFSRIAK